MPDGDMGRKRQRATGDINYKEIVEKEKKENINYKPLGVNARPEHYFVGFTMLDMSIANSI
jgi:hypothetical protein